MTGRTRTEQAQHTPGPWKVDETGEFIETEYPANLRGEYTHICDFRRPMGAEYRANARLIAAAPEMLEALREIHKLWCCPAPKTMRDWSARCDVMTDYARAAIAKAEGR